MSRPLFRPIPSDGPWPLSRPGAAPLAGGPLCFEMVEVLERGRAPQVIRASDLDDTDLAPLTGPRAPIAGVAFDRPRLMGILNVTPDSFSDGGTHADPARALAQARRMAAAGADILDIGGESTRPGAAEVPAEDEIARVAPVIARLRRGDGLAPPLSLDTRKASVARAVAPDIINDVSGLRHDPALADVAAETGAALIVMHSIGTPETMQALAETAYDDVLIDVFEGLSAAIATAEAAGVPRAKIMVDPGIGFGKTDPQNLALLRRIGVFHGLGCAILLGVSRKGMVGRLTGEPDASRRDAGSAGIGLWAVSQGIQMLRVHDITTHRAMLQTWAACRRAR